MVGADATIVWVDRDNTPHAEDYYLSDYIPVSSLSPNIRNVDIVENIICGEICLLGPFL